MKKEIFEEVQIPEGVEATINGSTLILKGKGGEITRTFKMKDITFKKEGGKIILANKKATKKEKKMIYTNLSHIKNMFRGVQEKFEYQLKVVSSHFPITVTVEGDKAVIKNFLGEKEPRESKIPKGAEVKVDKGTITVSSVDKEIAGQTAANLERATIIRNRDRRVFQDGIYMINKAGKEI